MVAVGLRCMCRKSPKFMLQLKLIPLQTNEQGSISMLLHGFKFICFMLELPERNNRACISRIPRGATYFCKYISRSASGKYKRVWHVQNVPKRSGILQHSGNFGGDASKGWQTHLLGCQAPCLKVATLRNKYGERQLAGLQSKSALARMRKVIGINDYQLEII